MDAATGEIYAACSLPYMNPADMSSSQVGSESVKAITQAYEPGSTFKSVSALTILEQGTMGPEDTMFCPSSISADDYDVSDSHERDGETYSLREILNHSSNVGISLATEQNRRVSTSSTTTSSASTSPNPPAWTIPARRPATCSTSTTGPRSRATT